MRKEKKPARRAIVLTMAFYVATVAVALTPTGWLLLLQVALAVASIWAWLPRSHE